ncbi:sulfotransferase family 2 domain-containing protein [Ameyamaea chiangmaiensis]|nr:sulfotransferase family 2 domain-containing protein [Ameyamaea chiangmaiensis]MBS4075889.1 sulfotransferase family 2 domain-containing protein [Ameyamaea chiangmaiensis]
MQHSIVLETGDSSSRPDVTQHGAGALARRAIMAAFGVSLFWDVHERAADLRLPLPVGRKRRERLDLVRGRHVLFIHVPKNAGTSISNVLYGRSLRHETIRYYRHIDPSLNVPSFALWRDPVERFLSAFRFGRQGGGRLVRMAPVFAAQYRTLNTLDDAIAYVGARLHTPYRLDHVFRPQAWYVTDRHGALAVDRLIDMRALDRITHLVPGLDGLSIPHLNETGADRISATPEQAARIRALYQVDEALRAHLSA